MKFDLHYLFSAKCARWMSLALILLFSSLIIVECFTLKLSPIRPLSIPKPDRDILGMTQQNSLAAVLNSSLFGVYVSNPTAPAQIQKSPLNVNLIGILFANKEEDSQVIISSASGEENTYKLGDTLPGNAVIKRIMADKVLVEHNGALESLSLPKNELIFEPVAKPLEEHKL